MERDLIKNKEKDWKTKGQMSVFMAFTLVILFTLMAFIINVGLFVKAKINLQNAVDAAAWSGAAVQARQLTNIGFLNWELRNNYKEWMFKYYILGQLGLKTTLEKDQQGSSMNFRMDTFAGDTKNFDKYNIPSICIRFAGRKTNICQIYKVPGLPRFGGPDLPGISRIHETFLNNMVETKSQNCSERSDLNFGVALLWAYGTGGEGIGQAPQIASNRVGAWPMAFELGLRMRNLEMIVNRPPIRICSSGQGGCQTPASLVSDRAEIGYNQRPYKAFMAAYRNLSGGASKGGDRDGEGGGDTFSDTLMITELSPKENDVGEGNLSSFLIPSTTGQDAIKKRYLDLIVFPLNLVTFFTSFITESGEEDGTATEAACPASKTALPVPGYIFGFGKNPEVITYYAVKGEADFIGMFYPFTEQSGIRLSAYAAAKPFGGRIGPWLFKPDQNKTYITPRASGSNSRSAAYISRLNTQGLEDEYKPGNPIPNSSKFWVQSVADPVGGVPGTTSEVKYAIPNLLYDWLGDMQTQASAGGSGGDGMMAISPAGSVDETQNLSEKVGLYAIDQFGKFRDNLNAAGESGITAESIIRGIYAARGPTTYEAINYLIPSNNNASGNFDTIDLVPENEGNYQLFAPLNAPGTLYESPDAVLNILSEYIRQNEQSISAYLQALFDVSQSIRKQQTRGADVYEKAANTIFPKTDSFTTQVLETNIQESSGECGKLALASKFYQFFQGKGDVCNIKPLAEALRQYWDTKQSQGGFDKYHTYQYTTELPQGTLMTAFRPGTRQGVSPEGEIQVPFPGVQGGGDVEVTKRNFYSTKLISLAKILDGSSPLNYGRSAVYQERGSQLEDAPQDIQEASTRGFVNTLDGNDPDIQSLSGQGLLN